MMSAVLLPLTPLLKIPLTLRVVWEGSENGFQVWVWNTARALVILMFPSSMNDCRMGSKILEICTNQKM